MKKISLIILLLFVSASVWGAETASAVLERTAAKIRAAKSLVVDYSLTAGGQTVDGVLTIAGNCFQLNSSEVKSWYDGKTQWTYSTHIGEINITEPTREELLQVNPFAIIQSFSTDYTATLLKSPGGFSNIRLSAKRKNLDITGATITINNTTGYPTAVKLVMNGGQTISIRVKSVSPGGLLPVSRFRFDHKAYPAVEVVDLR